MAVLWGYAICVAVMIECVEMKPVDVSQSSMQIGRGRLYDHDVQTAKNFLEDFDNEATRLTKISSQASWDYETDLTGKNLEKTVNLSVVVSEFFLEESEQVSKIKILDLPTSMQRQINIIRRNADSASSELRKEVRELEGKMTSIFGKGKVCQKRKNNTCKYLSLEPDLVKIMRKSRDLDKLLFAWKGWRDAVGPKIKPYYERIVDLLNIGAREHGWIDYGDFLRSEYEQGDDFEINLRSVWEDIKPLYTELHAFVRYRLGSLYKRKLEMNKFGTIPAHVLGDMFAQNWDNIFEAVKPFSNVDNFDVTESMKRKNFTVENIFRLAESFFVSIGLYKMPDGFWKKSVLKKIKSKDMVCHASAWDFSLGDVRIKMCTQLNQDDMITVHHEMGHVEYFIAYQNQPYAFRNGANPGFHEAIGDTVSLSVESPHYLKQIGLLDETEANEDNVISFLLRQALRRVAPIPYNYLVDKWRWRVYAGNITENNYNSEWWKLRIKYQGVSPPVKRKEDDFDPASKYHIGANVPYIAYFVSYILQFQLHRSLCRAAGITQPLYNCSIYESKKAGAKFLSMLEAGRSKPWPKILKSMTGERDLSASAINEYFQPLFRWLTDYRVKHRYPLGWEEEDLSSKVLHRKEGKFESGQERSGILKTNNKGISLSINIPSLNVAANKDDATKNDGIQAEKGDGEKVTVPMIDLAKLLSSGSKFSVSTTETSANTKDGATTISNKEFSLNNEDDNSKAGKQGQNSTEAATTNSNPTAANLTDVNKSNSSSNSSMEVAKNSNAAGPLANKTSENGIATNQTAAPSNNVTVPVNNNTATPVNQTLAWQSAVLEKGENATTSSINQTVAGNNTNHEANNATVNNIINDGSNAVIRNKSPCRRDSVGSKSKDCGPLPDNPVNTVSISPAELIQHVLMSKVKNVVQKALPQANVQKTNSGFTVNFDLNPKDEIPSGLPSTMTTAANSKTRQQHVSVFIAPKGVVVKPKSSDQLMKPSFVPIQNQDNIELRGGK
eukprot:gene11083-12251_t